VHVSSFHSCAEQLENIIQDLPKIQKKRKNTILCKSSDFLVSGLAIF